MTSSLFLLLVALAPAAPPDAPKGERVALTDGTLFVPEGYRPAADGIDLVLHLHGSADVAEKNLARSGKSAVLVSVIQPGLSSVYTKKFQDPKVFAGILDEVAQHLKTPKFRRVLVSSFSAGFGGVRELLKDAKTFERIDALILADTVYAGYVDSPKGKKVNPEQMAGFLKFATEAAAGRKWMIVSHCELQPDGYASTGETATYLITQLGGSRENASDAWPAEGMTLQSRFLRKQLEIYGFDGTTGKDHMRHLHGAWVLMKRVP